VILTSTGTGLPDEENAEFTVTDPSQRISPPDRNFPGDRTFVIS
jgi:hypothetical protein